MTTIATDGKTMAGDGLSHWANSILSRRVVKIRKIGKELFGFSGSSDQAHSFIKWYKAGADPDNMPSMSDLNVLMVNKSGVYIACQPAFNFQRVDRVMAIGSGADYAVGAMAAGKKPREAVRIASRYDWGTGGRITVLEL